ncbi:MAG: ABC transporter ATP-binding protein [Prevotella sp.]|nr:ABC transporter ATP-binding protein [Prevotella sp.]
MIQLQDVSFRYAGSDAQVFNGFSLTLEPGRIYGLLGPNGSGKSTLLYLVMGLLRAEKGSVAVDGRETSRREHALLSELFIVPEEFELPPLTLSEYVDTYRPFYPRFSDDVLRQCLEEFELPSQLHINRLSMGQKKKVLMAFALACGTRYLLMDEPTNGLDIQSKKQFRRVIASLPALAVQQPSTAAQQPSAATIVIATHQVHDVEQLLDHVVILGDSRDAEASGKQALAAPSTVLCDAVVQRLTDRLAFTLQPFEPAPGEALYYERTPLGYACVAPRQPGDEETPLNLELLYHTVQCGQLPSFGKEGPGVVAKNTQTTPNPSFSKGGDTNGTIIKTN